jgi:hypothetical protein
MTPNMDAVRGARVVGAAAVGQGSEIILTSGIEVVEETPRFDSEGFPHRCLRG